jgi:hypothetical protein
MQHFSMGNERIFLAGFLFGPGTGIFITLSAYFQAFLFETTGDEWTRGVFGEKNLSAAARAPGSPVSVKPWA